LGRRFFLGSSETGFVSATGSASGTGRVSGTSGTGREGGGCT
jgi:hypothetical protein